MYVNVFLRNKFLLIYTWRTYRPSDFVTTPVYIQELMKTLGTWELAILLVGFSLHVCGNGLWELTLVCSPGFP